MPDTGTIIDAVHRASAVLAEAGDVVIADALATFATHGVPLHQALGLAPDWHAVMRRRQRDAALVALVRHFPDLRGRRRACAMAAALARYAAANWPRAHRAGVRPGGIDGAMYDVLAADGEPLGAERVYQLIRRV